MQLEYRELLLNKLESLRTLRTKLKKQPNISLVWVGDDLQTKKFVGAKQKMAAQLECEFVLHHFPQMEERQLSAVIEGISSNKNIDGIVLQLPLPKSINASRMINLLDSSKDIDNLRGLDLYKSPTPEGIIELLKFNNIDLSSIKTCILGDGRLVGAPLAKMFKQNSWNFIQISSDAAAQKDIIKDCQLLISCTGVEGLIDESYVSKDMIVVDGSGVDVQIARVESLCRAVTPPKGCIGPLTVLNLYENLLTAASR